MEEVNKEFEVSLDDIMSAKSPIIKEPHPQPLPKSGEGRQSTALAGWGSSGLISNQADMI